MGAGPIHQLLRALQLGHVARLAAQEGEHVHWEGAGYTRPLRCRYCWASCDAKRLAAACWLSCLAWWPRLADCCYCLAVAKPKLAMAGCCSVEASHGWPKVARGWPKLGKEGWG
jgi:hypothetical protein